MLQKIRAHTHGWMAWVLIGVLAFVFMLWGIAGELISSPADKTVAEVAGKPITSGELQVVYERLAQQSQMAQMMAGIQSPILNEQQIRKQALDSLIMERTLSAAANSQGFLVTPEQVNSILVRLPQFQVNGEFSPSLYERIVRQMNFTPETFRDTVQKEMLITQAQSTIRDSVFLLPYQIQDAVDLVNQTRDIQYAIFKADTFLKEVKITPEDLRAYYDSHQSEFMTDETVTATYVLIDQKDLTDKLKDKLQANDQELENYYQDNISRFSSSEARAAKHILVSVPPGASESDKKVAKTKADKILAQLKGGASFSDLAKKESDDTGSAAMGGDLGTFGRGEMVPEFEAAVFNAKSGDLVGPVQTDFGYHIISVGKIQPAKVKSFAEVKATLAQEWLDEKVAEAYDKELSDIDQVAFENPDSLIQLSEQFDLPVQTITISKDADKNTGHAATEAVIHAAFSEDVLFARQNSELIRLSPEQAMILRVSEHQTPKVQPFDTVKESLQATMLERQGLFLAREKTNAILEAYQKGEPLEKLAKEQGFTWTTVKKLSRQNTQQIAPQILTAAFSTPKGEKPAMVGAELANSGSGLVVVTAIHPGDIDPQFAQAMIAEFNQSLQEFKGIRDFNFYVTAAKDKADVTIE